MDIYKMDEERSLQIVGSVDIQAPQFPELVAGTIQVFCENHSKAPSAKYVAVFTRGEVEAFRRHVSKALCDLEMSAYHSFQTIFPFLCVIVIYEVRNVKTLSARPSLTGVPCLAIRWYTNKKKEICASEDIFL